jgi:protoheme IX farnesyltransferase
MAASNGTIKATQTLAGIEPGIKSRAAIYADLFKARLTFLVLLTTLVGFYAASDGRVNYLLMTHTLLGTALVASGAAALNHFLERDFDALMRRTRNRPLPSGRLAPRTALWVGMGAALGGVAYLAVFVSLLVSALGTASLVTYVLVYTPLKRVTWLNTLVGAIPGAIPPLMGWAGAKGELGFDALPLFCLLAFWQIPHFLAIAWMYRDEYEKAGFKMLPHVDPDGGRTGRQSLVSSVALAAASLFPFFLGISGVAYAAGAVVLGGIFVWFAWRFRQALTISAARQLFFASILYLPLVLATLVLDKN